MCPKRCISVWNMFESNNRSLPFTSQKTNGNSPIISKKNPILIKPPHPLYVSSFPTPKISSPYALSPPPMIKYN